MVIPEGQKKRETTEEKKKENRLHRRYGEFARSQSSDLPHFSDPDTLCSWSLASQTEKLKCHCLPVSHKQTKILLCDTKTKIYTRKKYVCNMGQDS